MKLILPIFVAVAVVVISGCAPTFTRVDFKYSSIAHLSYRDAMTTINKDPETLVFELSEAFRRQGGMVLQRQELGYHLELDAAAQLCWEANTSIYEKEFASFEKNSYKQYRKINRTKPYTSRGVSPQCRIFDEVPTGSKTSWMLMVQFPPRSANATIYRPVSNSFFVFNGIDKPLIQGFGTTRVPQNVGIEISTRLYIWAWKGVEGKTVVYLEGRPFSGQVEAASGNSIGWQWWKISNGYQEADVVRSYLLLIQDYDRASIRN